MSSVSLPSLPSHISWVAVSKKQPIDKILALYELGHRDFGENYAQELIEKQFQLQHLADLRWHFIGQIQKNKLKYILGKVYLIHSVGNFATAETISEKCQRWGIEQNVLLQMNLAHESTKQGFTEKDLETYWESLIKLPGLRIVGLMTLPPLFDQAEDVRPFFKRLREIRDQYRMNYPALKELSMGTSHDYQVAIDEGATWVRLGTMVFGPRQVSQEPSESSLL
jgi:pyridoxal phosphate enzyme (YggS family)